VSFEVLMVVTVKVTKCI